MARILQHFDALSDQGLQIIPLNENSKTPRIRGWSGPWNRKYCREVIRSFPESNIGLLLGEIVDVEGDSDQANAVLLNLIGDYPHPIYRSKKSLHHLFLSPDPDLNILCHDKIEFRGYGHQSVLPPSVCGETRYMWIKGFTFPVPPMPERLASYYWKLKRKRNTSLKRGHQRIWCGKCRKECFLHQKRLTIELQVCKSLEIRWECRACRTLDFRPICKTLRKTGKIVLS